MTIATAAIQEGSSGITATGGSSVGFNSLGDDGSSHTAQIGSDDFLSGTFVTFSKTDAKPSATAPNGYTQRRNALVLKVPMTLDNGNTTINTVRVEMSRDVEANAAIVDSLRYAIAQLVGDSDFDNYWRIQSLS